MRADFGGYSLDRARAVKARAGTFVRAAAVAYVAAFAFFFVVVQELSNLFANVFVESGEYVTL